MYIYIYIYLYIDKKQKDTGDNQSDIAVLFLQLVTIHLILFAQCAEWILGERDKPNKQTWSNTFFPLSV